MTCFHIYFLCTLIFSVLQGNYSIKIICETATDILPLHPKSVATFSQYKPS